MNGHAQAHGGHHQNVARTSTQLRAMAFCVSVAHVEHCAEMANAAGISSVAIDGKTPQEPIGRETTPGLSVPALHHVSPDPLDRVGSLRRRTALQEPIGLVDSLHLQFSGILQPLWQTLMLVRVALLRRSPPSGFDCSEVRTRRDTQSVSC